MPDPFSLLRIKFNASEIDIMEVVARCPRKSNPHVDGWRFETPRALGSPYTLARFPEAMNAEVPLCVAWATSIPLGNLDPEQRRAQEQELRDQKGTQRPIGIGSLLVRFANRALLAVFGAKVSQWLCA
jgi:hypothetical protein